MNDSFKISYYLRTNSSNKKGENPIMVRISLKGQRCSLSSGLVIDPKKWDSQRSCMKGNSTESRMFNLKIVTFNASLIKIIKKLEVSDKLDIKYFKEAYKGQNCKQDNHMLLALFDEYNKGVEQMVGVDITKPTYQRYLRARKYFGEYLQANYKKSDISLNELNHLLLDHFIVYLKREKHYSHNSTVKLIQPLKTVADYAYKKGIWKIDLVRDYQIKREKTDRGFLREDELQKIMKKKFSISRLEKVRDIFIFSCFTGLAYIDVANLTRDNLVENNGQYWIMTHRQKTSVASNILLLNIPCQIIKKYNAEDNNGKLLPILSNQKMNAYLKEIADLCGIQKNLTFHLARHTFATTVTLEKGVPIETVSKMLGHTNIRTTQIYARITTDKIQREMLELSEKLDNYAMTI